MKTNLRSKKIYFEYKQQSKYIQLIPESFEDIPEMGYFCVQKKINSFKEFRFQIINGKIESVIVQYKNNSRLTILNLLTENFLKLNSKKLSEQGDWVNKDIINLDGYYESYQFAKNIFEKITRIFPNKQHIYYRIDIFWDIDNKVSILNEIESSLSMRWCIDLKNLHREDSTVIRDGEYSLKQEYIGDYYYYFQSRIYESLINYVLDKKHFLL